MKNYYNFRIIQYTIVIVVIFSIVWGFYKIQEWLYSYCSTPLSYVIVTGDRCFTTNDEINNAILQLGTLGTFITQNVNIIQKQIEQLPWIEQVSVRKQWPNTLKIHLIEYIPVAYWNDNLIISTTGNVLKIPNIHKTHQNNNIKWMPVLYGPENKAQDILNKYLIFQEILKSNRFQIKSVQMDMSCSWNLGLMGDIYLKLGRDNIINRLCYFIKIYPILIQKICETNKSIEYIDLRYRSGFALKWVSHSIIFTKNVYNNL